MDKFGETISNLLEYCYRDRSVITWQPRKHVCAHNCLYKLWGVLWTFKEQNTISTQLPPIECTPDNERGISFTRVDNSTTFSPGIGVLVALLLTISVGWIVSFVILLRRGQTVHKQQWVVLNTHLMFSHTNVFLFTATFPRSNNYY